MPISNAKSNVNAYLIVSLIFYTGQLGRLTPLPNYLDIPRVSSHFKKKVKLLEQETPFPNNTFMATENVVPVESGRTFHRVGPFHKITTHLQREAHFAE